MRCLKLEEWPEADRAAWQTRLRLGDLFEPGGVATTWAEATRGMELNGYGRWLTWLVQTGRLDPTSSPADRVTTEAASSYLAELKRAVAPFTVSARIQQLGNAMRVIAPSGDWRWLQRAADRLQVGATSVRNKRERLQSPEQLIALGRSLMNQADTALQTAPTIRATLCRDGLMIAFLAHRPMRRKNLAAMRLGTSCSAVPSVGDVRGGGDKNEAADRGQLPGRSRPCPHPLSGALPPGA